jgi:hypothetical protein
MPLEELLVGWKEIGAYFRLPPDSMQRRFGERLLKCGCAFRMRRGTPPRVFVCAWPSQLQFFALTLSEGGAILQ